MSVGKSELINQICANSGLKGKELQELKTCLSKLSEAQLQNELSKSLSGKETQNIGFNNFVEQNPPSAFSGNVFGSGFNHNSTTGLSIERQENPDTPKEIGVSEKEGIDLLKTITGEAKQIVDARESEAGFLSSAVNTWQEVFNKELAKSTVTREIKNAETDIKLLEAAAKGEAVNTNYFTGETTSTSFEEMFKKRRGVDYSLLNVVNCKQEAEKFSRVKTASEMIKSIKSELAVTTKGDVASQMSPEKSSAAIVKAFNLSGVTSSKDMNAVLKDIEEKNKNNPDIKKYGGNLRLEKDKNGRIMVMRTTSTGNDVPASNEELRIIANEMSKRLDTAYANALGVEIPENATQEQIVKLTDEVFEKHQKSYEEAFEEAYGSKDLKGLAERYVQAQQQSVANIEAGLNIASMALMIIPGGAAATSGWLLKGSIALKATQTGSKLVKGLSLVDKAKSAVRIAQGLQKAQQIVSPLVMGNLTLHPTQLLEKLSSDKGMTKEDWEEWGKEVLQSSTYMALGMGSSRIAEEAAAMYRTKALVSTLKNAGKTTDEIAAMIKSSPAKFPNDIVKSFSKVDNIAKGLQVSTEVAIDITSTYAANQVMGNGDLTKQDWIMSVGFALSGGVLQKQFAPLSKEAKVKYIQDAFKDMHISKEEALNILKTMDGISSGKIRAKKAPVNPQTREHGANELPEVVVKPETSTPKSDSPAVVKNASEEVKITDEAVSAETTTQTEPEFVPFKPNKSKTAMQIENEEVEKADKIIIEKIKEAGDGEALAEKIAEFGGSENEHMALMDFMLGYKKQIEFNPEERQFILETTYGGKEKLEEQLKIAEIGKTDNDIANIYTISRGYSFGGNEIVNTLRTAKSNSENFGVTDAQFDIDKVIKSFQNREFKMYDSEYLYFINQMLIKADNLMQAGKTEEALKRINFDYSKMHERDIFEILKPSKVTEQMEELLFCSDEEFLKKYERIQKNRDLFFPENYKKNLDKQTWSKLLNATEDEFNKLITPIDKRPVVMTDMDAYRAEIQDKLSKPLAYKPEDADKIDFKQLTLDRPGRYKYKPQKVLPFEGLPEKPVKPAETLDIPHSRDLMMDLFFGRRQSINIEIPEKGGLNPTRSEKPIIHPEDIPLLGKVQDAEIELKYGVQRNWSNTKIARDIMQNFYDGNGHTLEGVKIEVEKSDALKDGREEFIVRVSGEGDYDYTHLDYLGDSDKEFDPSSAGNFGEGTRIVAVNLLANRNAPYVKYACGDWAMSFEKSSNDIKTGYMTQTLTKNEQPVKGSYIEFRTTNENLVQEVLNSKDYFYSPYNKDFQNLDFENEFFGFKQLPKGQKGNVYIVQRYETLNGINETLDGMTLVFKKMPNAPELIEKSGEKFSLNDRDRSYLSTYDITKLVRRYSKTMTDEELTQTIVSMKSMWEFSKSETEGSNNTCVLEALLYEARSRDLGIDFGKEKYFTVDDKTSPDDIQMAEIMGYRPAKAIMTHAGMDDYNSIGVNIKQSIPPEILETQRIKLLDEGMRIIQENLGYKDLRLLTEKEVDAPKFVYEKGGSESAEAIVYGTTYNGHWVKRSKLLLDDFVGNLATWLHESQHKLGEDTDTSFSLALQDIQTNILKILTHNPDALAKMQELARMYDETMNTSGTAPKAAPAEKFSPAKYKQEISQLLDTPSEYTEYIEKSKEELEAAQPQTSSDHKTITKTIAGTSSFGLDKDIKRFKSKTGLMDRLKSSILKLVRKKADSNPSEHILENPELDTRLQNAPKTESSKPVTPYQKLPERTTVQTSERLMSTDEALKALDVYKSVKVDVPNQGGLNPTRSENPVIHQKDIEKLGQKERVRIKLKYGQKTNWSDAKLARDIMQNFFDGNGHTMEGVSIDVVKTADGYKIRVSGDGHFDYEHLKRIGASDKPDDAYNAGSFGEGTRIVAVNLLANKNVPGVKYACGDWAMTFEKSSDDISKAHMTRTLDKNETPVKGTYLEFTTPNENLLKEIFNAKDYFYHPYNKDFQNLEFENEFFGFKHTEQGKAGNIYLVQRYETPEHGMEGSVDDMTLVFKQMPNSPELRNLVGYKYDLDTGCDRVALSDNTVRDLASRYAYSMSDEELTGALASLEDIWTSPNPSDPKFKYDAKGANISFAKGLAITARNRLKLDLSKEKIAVIQNINLFDREKIDYLKERGYKFTSYEMGRYLGIKTAEEIFDNFHRIRSIEPTKAETQKLQLIREAINLFKDRDTYRVLPEMADTKEYVYDKNNSPNKNIHIKASIDGNKYKGLLIDRECLGKMDFYTLLSEAVAEMLHVHGTTSSSKYSYELTDMLRSELKTFINDPSVSQKLLTLKEMYDSIK